MRIAIVRIELERGGRILANQRLELSRVARDARCRVDELDGVHSGFGAQR